jgi:hypothetical protein
MAAREPVDHRPAAGVGGPGEKHHHVVGKGRRGLDRPHEAEAHAGGADDDGH